MEILDSVLKLASLNVQEGEPFLTSNRSLNKHKSSCGRLSTNIWVEDFRVCWTIMQNVDKDNYVDRLHIALTNRA